MNRAVWFLGGALTGIFGLGLAAHLSSLSSNSRVVEKNTFIFFDADKAEPEEQSAAKQESPAPVAETPMQKQSASASETPEQNLAATTDETMEQEFSAPAVETATQEPSATAEEVVEQEPSASVPETPEQDSPVSADETVEQEPSATLAETMAQESSAPEKTLRQKTKKGKASDMASDGLTEAVCGA